MRINQIIPIFRMFDEAKAREFYLNYLGATVTFEHRFDADAPLYLGLLLGGVELHLSEHYGDATPGSTVRLEVENLASFHADLSAKNYRYARPGIQEQPWGFLEVSINDPFGNKVVFCEPQQSIVSEREKRPQA